jgi:adenine-specific DNA-methyltransferase
MPRRKDVEESAAIIQEILGGEAIPGNVTAALERTLSLLNRGGGLGLQWESQYEQRPLWGLPIVIGEHAMHANEGEPTQPLLVRNIEDDMAYFDGDLRVPCADLVRVAKSGEATYPTIDETVESHRSDADVVHRIIESDNLDALHLLNVWERGTYDVIYIDPPYGSGATDWTYNNRFVNPNHAYKSSMWLSMIHGRLAKAKSLLKQDGVLIIAIDDFHMHRLRSMLDRQWRGWTQRVLPIRHHPTGGKDDEYQKIHEYAIVLTRDQSGVVKLHQPKKETTFNWNMSYTRSGAGDMNERSGRPRSCGALLINTEILDASDDTFCTEAVVGIEPPHPCDEEMRERWINQGREFSDPIIPLGELRARQHSRTEEGLLRIYPVGISGVENCARRSYERVNQDISRGVQDYAVRSSLSCFLKSKPSGTKKPRSMWGEIETDSLERDGRRFNASTHGTNMVKRDIFAGQERFSYPKSLYNVYDLVEMACWLKPEAKVLDFYGGSGTTLHATMLLNKVYQGRRQCTLVVNTEMKAEERIRLWDEGIRPWTNEWAEASNSRRACWPRNYLVALGQDVAENPLDFDYDVFRLDHPDATFPANEGFEDGIEFYRLGFFDPADVGLGRSQFSEGMVDFLSGGRRKVRQDVYSVNDLSEIPVEATLIIHDPDPDIVQLVQSRFPNHVIRSFHRYRSRLRSRVISQDIFGCD